MTLDLCIIWILMSYVCIPGSPHKLVFSEWPCLLPFAPTEPVSCAIMEAAHLWLSIQPSPIPQQLHRRPYHRPRTSKCPVSMWLLKAAVPTDCNPSQHLSVVPKQTSGKPERFAWHCSQEAITCPPCGNREEPESEFQLPSFSTLPFFALPALPTQQTYPNTHQGNRPA